MSEPEYQFSDETDDVVCEVCGGRSGIGIRRVMFDGFSCQHCLFVWYEYGLIDSARVREASLARQALLDRSAQKVEQPYWLCCGSTDYASHQRPCIEAIAHPAHCRWGTASEHSDWQLSPAAQER
jgi:hypothetical protein